MVYLYDEEKQRPVRILFAAEKEFDIKNVWMEFQKLQLGNSVYPVKSGYDVLDFLFLMGKFSYLRYERPDLILFGTEIEDMDRVKVLEYLRQVERFSDIPVMLLSPYGDKTPGWIEAGNKVAYLPSPMNGMEFLKRLACLDVPWILKEGLSDGFCGSSKDALNETTTLTKRI